MLGKKGVGWGHIPRVPAVLVAGEPGQLWPLSEGKPCAFLAKFPTGMALLRPPQVTHVRLEYDKLKTGLLPMLSTYHHTRVCKGPMSSCFCGCVARWCVKGPVEGPG